MLQRLRIACIDREPADRIALSEYFDSICEQHRTSVGHISFIQSHPTSMQEILLTAAPDVFAVGPRMKLDEAYSMCAELHATFPSVPIFLFLQDHSFKLKTLRHFDHYCRQIFSECEVSSRVVYELLRLLTRSQVEGVGSVVNIIGAKGGTGVTSLTTGLAQAVEALGYSSIVVDFSSYGVLPYYLACEKWVSQDYTTALTEGLGPDARILETTIVQAPSGIPILLPPAGGATVRNLWLRDADRFECSLALFDLCAQRFDVVLVDQAGVEGILPYALTCRADMTMLVTSNDPASVHLLGHVLTDVIDAPGSKKIQIIVNESLQHGLRFRDTVDFLGNFPSFVELLPTVEQIPFDSRGKNWIGTANSFYAESGKATRMALERLAGTLLVKETSPGTSCSPAADRGSLSVFRSSIERLFGRRRLNAADEPKALPSPDMGKLANLHGGVQALYEPPTICQ